MCFEKSQNMIRKFLKALFRVFPLQNVKYTEGDLK